DGEPLRSKCQGHNDRSQYRNAGRQWNEDESNQAHLKFKYTKDTKSIPLKQRVGRHTYLMDQHGGPHAQQERNRQRNLIETQRLLAEYATDNQLSPTHDAKNPQRCDVQLLSITQKILARRTVERQTWPERRHPE